MQIDEAIDLMIAIKNAPEDSPIGAARSLQKHIGYETGNIATIGTLLPNGDFAIHAMSTKPPPEQWNGYKIIDIFKEEINLDFRLK